jgi:hypothetical protein
MLYQVEVKAYETVSYYYIEAIRIVDVRICMYKVLPSKKKFKISIPSWIRQCEVLNTFKHDDNETIEKERGFWDIIG